MALPSPKRAAEGCLFSCLFQIPPRCEGDLGTATPPGLSQAYSSLIHGTLLSVHGKGNFTIASTPKLDPDCSARLPWCSPAPLAVSTPRGGQAACAVSGCGGLHRMLLLTGRTAWGVPGTEVLCLAVAAPWTEWGIPLGRGFLWGVCCTPQLLPLGLLWSWIGLTPWAWAAAFSGSREERSGLPGQGTGGDFLRTLLCEWNDSLCKDAFLCDFKQLRVMELSPYLQCVAKSNKWQWLYCRKKGGGESCYFLVGITAAFIFMQMASHLKLMNSLVFSSNIL